MTPKKDGVYQDINGNKLQFLCGTVDNSFLGLVMKFKNLDNGGYVFLKLHECDVLEEVQ